MWMICGGIGPFISDNNVIFSLQYNKAKTLHDSWYLIVEKWTRCKQNEIIIGLSHASDHVPLGSSFSILNFSKGLMDLLIVYPGAKLCKKKLDHFSIIRINSSYIICLASCSAHAAPGTGPTCWLPWLTLPSLVWSGALQLTRRLPFHARGGSSFWRDAALDNQTPHKNQVFRLAAEPGAP